MNQSTAKDRQKVQVALMRLKGFLISRAQWLAWSDFIPALKRMCPKEVRRGDSANLFPLGAPSFSDDSPRLPEARS